VDFVVTSILLAVSEQVGVRYMLTPTAPHSYLYGRVGSVALLFPTLCESEDCYQPVSRYDVGLGIVPGWRLNRQLFVEGGAVALPDNGKMHMILHVGVGALFRL
jgi:hypothetical protein